MIDLLHIPIHDLSSFHLPFPTSTAQGRRCMMIHHSIMIEFARDVVNDERHNELKTRLSSFEFWMLSDDILERISLRRWQFDTCLVIQCFSTRPSGERTSTLALQNQGQLWGKLVYTTHNWQSFGFVSGLRWAIVGFGPGIGQSLLASTDSWSRTRL